MKPRTDRIKLHHNHISEESDLDCSCELLDTSLSAVGDSECSCSECLEANLEAFNELKELEEQNQNEHENRFGRRASSRITQNRQTRQTNRNMSTVDQKTKLKINGYKSTDKLRETRHNHKGNSLAVSNLRQQLPQPEDAPFSRQSINEYLKITQYRARQFLNQRKKIEKNEKIQRDRLKAIVKENLQKLKFTIMTMREQERGQKEGEFDPDYKWNHRPYHCKSRIECRKRIPYSPDLKSKEQEIDKINERIRQYQKKNKKQKYECPDQCPKHHMRTSKKKLAEIEQFIKKKAKDYEEKRKKQKAQKQEKQKVRAAKLRAIDIRCKDIVAKSKKIDPNISVTSFHNTIDHFSTFSEMRVVNAQRQQLKEKKRKVRKEMKEGGFLEQQIYQNLSDNLIGDHPPIHSKLEAESRYDDRDQPQGQQWCQKIVKEARIKPPKEVKKEDKYKKEIKKQDQKKRDIPGEGQATSKKNKRESEKNLRKEEQRRRQLQIEIERRKEEIFKEYQKRNTTAKNQAPKNKKIRSEYEENLRNQKSPTSKGTSNVPPSYDPYRQVYKEQPSKDPKQLKIVGDPLLQEYEYQKAVGRVKELSVSGDRQIFTKSGTILQNKQYLKV